MKRIERKCRERGSQIVELALVLPLLVFIVFVILQGAAAIRVHQVVNNAAREGARLAASPQAATFLGDSTPAVRQAVATYACNNGVLLGGAGACATAQSTCGGAVIGVNQLYPIGTTPSGAPIYGSQVSVSCTYTFSWIPNFSYINYTTNTVTLGGTAEFRNMWN